MRRQLDGVSEAADPSLLKMLSRLFCSYARLCTATDNTTARFQHAVDRIRDPCEDVESSLQGGPELSTQSAEELCQADSPDVPPR